MTFGSPSFIQCHLKYTGLWFEWTGLLPDKLFETQCFINDIILVPLFYFLAIQPFLPLILHIQSLSSFVVSMFFRPLLLI